MLPAQGKLQMSGTLTGEGKALSGATVRVYENGSAIANHQTDGQGRYSFSLALESQYQVEYTHKDFTAKRISVNTNVPPGHQGKSYGPLQIDIDLFINMPLLNVAPLRKPVYEIQYDMQKQAFSYDHELRKATELRLQGMVEELGRLRKLAFDKEIAKADRFYENNLYGEALKSYQKASYYLPTSNYARNRIYELRDYQRFFEDETVSSNDPLQDANTYYNDKNYYLARYFYKKALREEPTNSFAQQRLDEVETLIAREENQDLETEDGSLANMSDDDILAYLNQIEAYRIIVNENYLEIQELMDNIARLRQELSRREAELQSYKKISKQQQGALSRNEETLNRTQEELDKLNRSIADYRDSLKQQSGNTREAQIAMAREMENWATAYYDSSNYVRSIGYLEEAAKLNEELGQTGQQATVLKKIGVIYNNLYQFEQALAYFRKALQTAQQSGNEGEAADIAVNMGNIYYERLQYEEAIAYYSKALNYYKGTQAHGQSSFLNNNIGVCYYALGQMGQATHYFQQALKLARETGDKRQQARLLNNLGNIYNKQGQNQQAITYYQQSLNLGENKQDERNYISTLFNIGTAYLDAGQPGQADRYVRQSLDLAIGSGYEEAVYKSHYALSEIQKAQGNYKEALEHFQQFINSRFDIQIENMREISQVQMDYSVNKEEIEVLQGEVARQKMIAKLQEEKYEKEQELWQQERQTKEAQILAQKRLIWAIALISLIIAISILMIYRKNLRIRQANEQLRAQNIEIEKQRELATQQRDEIAKQQKKITDSITYARFIQQAVMPPEDFLYEHIPEHFVLYKPKDIVSGDFYWALPREGKLAVAAVDCTGHGVPGGFMSMMGVAFLNDIVNQIEPLRPDLALNQLREKTIESLRQSGKSTDSKDGMDLALVVLDKKNRKLQYAGAHNPLIIIRDGQLLETRADRMSISYEPKQAPFQNHELEVKKGDTIYIFSDGYADQFGGQPRRKFNRGNLHKLLIEIHQKPVEEQKQIMDKTIEEYKGNREQIDDILIIGMKI